MPQIVIWFRAWNCETSALLSTDIMGQELELASRISCASRSSDQLRASSIQFERRKFLFVDRITSTSLSRSTMFCPYFATLTGSECVVFQACIICSSKLTVDNEIGYLLVHGITGIQKHLPSNIDQIVCKSFTFQHLRCNGCCIE